MKKTMLFWATALLLAVLLTGCGTPEIEGSPVTNEPSSAIMETVESTNAVTEATSGETEEEFVYEGDASSYYIDVAYAEQIARYHTALTEKWDEGKYFENNMSAQPYYYYEGNPLENVGFGFVDLDNDGNWELIIGAILNADRDPAVFEIWTQVDGEPVMLAQGGARNRYMLQYVEEDDAWYVVNEGSSSAFCHATNFFNSTGIVLNLLPHFILHSFAFLSFCRDIFKDFRYFFRIFLALVVLFLVAYNFPHHHDAYR